MNKTIKELMSKRAVELRAADLRISYDVLRDGHNGGTTYATAGKVTKVVKDEMALTRLNGTIICFITRDSSGWGARYCADRRIQIAQQPLIALSNSYAYSHESLARVIARMT